MKNCSPSHSIIATFNKTSLVLLLLGLASCGEQNKKEMAASAETAVEVVTQVMDFQVQDSIQSGWQTIRYTNRSQEPHFLLIEKYPEGKTIDSAKVLVVPVFQKGMDLINEGKMEEAMAEFGKLPAWFQEVEFAGGTGLISPGQTAITSLKMQPGYYILECYVKMENGMFHSAMGMITDIEVLKDSTGYKRPDATVTLSISREGGIQAPESVPPGLQVFKVDFIDQGPHEHFIGHDVNLVKLGETANLDSLARWMNWSDPRGLISPAPSGVTFLGGVNDMPAGDTGYFTAMLSPGKYALISEVPMPAEKNMLKTLTVVEAAQ